MEKQGTDGELTLSVQRRNRKTTVTAKLGDRVIHSDTIDPASASGRQRFIEALASKLPTVDGQAAQLEEELLALAGDGDEKGKVSQADQLVQIGGAMELFHGPGGADAKGFVSFPVGDHRETWPIKSNGYRCALSRQFFLLTQKVPSTQAIQDALNVLTGAAIFDGPEYAVAVRIAEQSGSIFLDLADVNWRAVQVTATGWQVVSNPPVRFIRRRGMLPLPVPERGGSVETLRPFVNLSDDDAWRLYVAWLVAAFRPGKPFPVLSVNGEQGCAKSTACKMARELVDPNEAPLRRPPRDDRDVFIAASNSWIVGYDNLSYLSPDLADAICALATGGGYATRELYSDDEERLFSATRPIMVNGIEDLATRGDLADRALVLTLPGIPDDERRDESELWHRFRQARPGILGALLDAVVVALQRLPAVKLESRPRMADFATWIVAAEPALRWPAGSFLAAYADNRNMATGAVLEESDLVPLLLQLVASVFEWEGQAKDLLDVLNSKATDVTKKRSTWPKTPRKLGGELRRLAPALRRGKGLQIDFGDRDSTRKRRRLIRIVRTDNVVPDSPADEQEILEWTA